MIKSKNIRFILLAFLFGAFSSQITMSMDDDMVDMDPAEEPKSQKASFNDWVFQKIDNARDATNKFGKLVQDKLARSTSDNFEYDPKNLKPYIDSSVHLDTNGNGDPTEHSVQAFASGVDSNPNFAKSEPVEELEDHLPGMTPEEVAKLTPQEITNLSININKLTPDQISALTKEQIQAIDPTSIIFFDPVQFAKLNISALTDAQFNMLFTERSSIGKLKDITEAQLESLSLDQTKLCLNAKEGIFSKEQLEILKKRLSKFQNDDIETTIKDQSGLLNKTGNKAYLWFKNKTMKNFLNIFRSDKTILTNYLKDTSNDSLQAKTEKPFVTKAIEKLSRTGRMELINDVTRAEVDAEQKENIDATMQKNNNTSTVYTVPSSERTTLTHNIFEKNLNLFRKILPNTDIITFTHDKNKTAASYRFQIADMDDFKYDPNLSIEANAKLLRQQQNLDINVTDLDKKDPNYKGSEISADTNLSTNIKELLEKQNHEKAQQALAVDALQTTPIDKLHENIELKEYFKTASPDLISSMLTDATMAPINAEEIQYGTKLPSTHVEELFKHNAVEYQKLLPKTLALIPTKGKYGPPSFEIIDLSKIESNLLSTLDTINSLKPEYRMETLRSIAETIEKQQLLRLSTADIMDFLIKKYNVKLSTADKLADVEASLRSSTPSEAFKPKPTAQAPDTTSNPQVELNNMSLEDLQTLKAEVIRTKDNFLNAIKNKTITLTLPEQMEQTKPLAENLKKINAAIKKLEPNPSGKQ
jgi:hypothetical protein